MTNPLHAELEKEGLLHAGNWRMDEGELRFTVTPELAACKNVIYAFTSEDQPLYIGKTTKMMAKQLNAYQAPSPTQSAHIKNHAQIRQTLLSGAPVDIFILHDEKLVKMRWMEENPATIRESELIKQFRPRWNSGKMHLDKPRAPREAEAS